MKRLLAYLFIVLGLGLTFNVNAFAECIEGNCWNGYGIYSFPGGSKYVGEFKKGNQHGQGTYFFVGGGKYVGEWKKGKRQGKGIFTHADGKVEEGIWKKDKLIKPNG